VSDEPVGVLIIGAGASGAAFAWSIAGTGMKVLCLEQNPWVKQQDFPTNGLDWEKRSGGEYSPDPNVRDLPARLPGVGALGLAETVAADLGADATYGPRVESGLAALQVAARERDPAGFGRRPPRDLSSPTRGTPGAHARAHASPQPGVLLASHGPGGVGPAGPPPFPEGYEIEPTDLALLALLESRRLPRPDA